MRSLNPVAFRSESKSKFVDQLYIDFTSNDYLGMATSQELISEFKEQLNLYTIGSGGSRLLGGDHDLFHELEGLVASYYKNKHALFFNSGYQLNVGVISTICDKNTIIFADKYIHASLIDGIRLSGARLVRYHHNDYQHLKMLLEKYRHLYEAAFILSEGLFSMDGDYCDMNQLVTLKKEFNCKLYIDEAHSFGVEGRRGLGHGYLYHDQCDYLVLGFGKALGGQGAILLSSLDNKRLLIDKCRSFIYSTAACLTTVLWNIISFKKMITMDSQRQSLKKMAVEFATHLDPNKNELKSVSQIVPYIVGNESALNQLNNALRTHGYYTHAIRYPTVPKLQSRLRFSIRLTHNPTQLEKLCTLINQFQYEVN